MKIFISYSSKDEGLRQIAADISQCLINKGYKTFFDIARINGGSDPESKIKDAISESDGFIFLISPGSLNTCADPAGSYALYELNLARKKWNPPEDYVLPVNLIGRIDCDAQTYSYLKSAGIFNHMDNM